MRAELDPNNATGLLRNPDKEEVDRTSVFMDKVIKMINLGFISLRQDNERFTRGKD